MDHLIPLDAGNGPDFARDWYKLHVLLSKRLGERIAHDGTTRWTWSADPYLFASPAMTKTGVVLVRSFDTEVNAAAAELAARSIDTHVPEAGETVAFALNCSARRCRPGQQQSIRQRAEARVAGVPVATAGYPGNLGPQMEVANRLLGLAGLETTGDYTAFEDKPFLIRKGQRHEGRGVTIVGIFATGTARVKDREALDHVVRNGIGRDRGFGFGNLVLSPHSERIAA